LGSEHNIHKKHGHSLNTGSDQITLSYLVVIAGDKSSLRGPLMKGQDGEEVQNKLILLAQVR